MDHKNFGQLNVKPLVDDLVQKLDNASERLQREGQEAAEAVGQGWDEGIDYTIEKIKASSIKTDKAFKNLSEKIRKQVQQLSTNISGKDTKIKIDFSDVDINSEDIKKQIEKKVKSIKTSDLIDFDTKGFDNQLTNFVTLFVKYEEKLKSLKQDFPSISVPKDAQNNLKQQLVLANELKQMHAILNQPIALWSAINPKVILNDLSKLQQFTDSTKNQSFDGYDELSKVLKEIQGSLKVISDTFKNENSSMKSMAETGVTSFTSLSQAIIEVYNNLTQVQSLVDTISQKDFNITNVTQTGGGSSNIQAMTQQMAIARETMEHLRRLYDQAGDTLTLLGQGGEVGLVFEYSKQLQELDLTNINKSLKGANTEMKLASVVAEMQEYIDKLIQINELRNQYNLGEWKDTFMPTQRAVAKPVVTKVDTKATTTVVEKPTEVASLGNAEAQQMWQLKGAIDEVSNAIGRKNAGFIQEKDIVEMSVEAEKTKLKELVGVITNEIGLALDDIKAKFGQSFVVPELDKGNLQSSFDEIYNKFVELKDKIGTMQIDIGIDTTNITTAIQEALYAKEISANYEKLTFDNTYDRYFEYDGSSTFTNRITGEIFADWDEALRDFEHRWSGLFQSKDGFFLGTKEQMLSELFSNQNTNITPEQNDWAQVIVEAVNTQGSRIVEAIKLILPKNISENVNATDEKELANAFQTLVNAISDFGQQTGKKPDAFFRSIEANNSYASSIRTPEVDNALHTLGLLSNSGEITFTIPDTGVRNIGVAIGEQLVASGQDKSNVSNASELMKKLNEAAALGASVPRILSLIEKSNIPLGWAGTGDAVFQLQTRSPGVNIASPQANNDFSGITDEQIDRLIHTFEVMSKVGLYPDFIGDNILFDKQKGFSLIDLETENIHAKSMDDAQDMVQAFLKNVFREANLSSSDFQAFSGRVNQRLKLPSDKRLVNADTIAMEQMAVTQPQESKPSEVKVTPTMDDGAVAKVVADNVAKTPATIKVTPVVDSASNSEQAVDGEAQSAVDAAKTFVDAANAKKQFVEANKQVAEGAKKSTKAVKEEAEAAEQAKQTMTAVADDTVQPSNWDRIAKLQTDHGEDPFALSRSRTENVGDKSVRTIVESWSAIRDEDGELTGDMQLNTVKIINDFKKRTDAITKENEKIKTAQAYLQKFLTQFDNKTMGKGSLLSGYQDLTNLANSNSFKIDDIAKAEQMMSNLDAEYNKVVQSMRKGSSSMNPFVNAINGIDKMEDVLRSISLQFRTLDQQPDWLKEDIINLYKQLDDVTAEADIYAFAEGFGNLKVSINSVVESIRQQRTEQKLALSDFKALVKATKTRDTNTEKAAKEENGSAWKTYYTDRAAEQQKMIDAIRIGLTLTEEQETQLNAMAEKHALIMADITRENNKIEEQKQKYEEIMRLLEQNRADQAALDSGSLGTDNKGAYQQIINEDRAAIEELIANTDLNSEQKKSVNTLLGSIEDDRIAKVKEYIDLLKLQHDYEKKAAKEQDGSKMQSFYNDQVAKVKDKLQKTDIQALANQDEKNKLLELEVAHQRAIAEIKEKNKNAGLEKQLFVPQNKKIQEKFDAGYLNQEQYDNWQQQLGEYQNYIRGITQADQATINNRKQSLMQLYDSLTKMSNASKSFFASGGEILPKDMWFDKSQIDDISGSLMNLYDNIATERFEGMKTSVTGVNDKLGKLNFVVDDGSGGLTQYTIALDRASGATKLLQNNTKPTLTTLQKFGQSLKKDFTGLLTAVMGGTSIHTFVQYMRQGIQSVRELDLALTELKKVTDETEETYDKFLDTASSTSARIGSTLTDVTQATAEFAKLGYDIATAASMAESALVYTNVGDNVDVETGSQSIISTMKAFGIEAENTMSIVDKFNEVGKLIALR